MSNNPNSIAYSQKSLPWDMQATEMSSPCLTRPWNSRFQTETWEFFHFPRILIPSADPPCRQSSSWNWLWFVFCQIFCSSQIRTVPNKGKAVKVMNRLIQSNDNFLFCSIKYFMQKQVKVRSMMQNGQTQIQDKSYFNFHKLMKFSRATRETTISWKL